MTRQLALGLAAAHARGVVHRDLKPANVLVNEQGDACITDFGVARSAGNTGITDSGVIIGTPAYLSPEQARAEPLDGRSDLYALGLILFEMLTGTLPFRGGTPAEMMVQRIVRDPPSAATIKPELPNFAVRLCAHLLELKPAHRFQTAEEVVRAIDTRRVAGSLPGTRRRVRILAAIVCALALCVVAYLQWRSVPGQPQQGAVLASAATLDLVSLPLIVDSENLADRELGAGASRLLAESLAGRDDVVSADSLRTGRALAELGYDANAAQRNRERVLEVMYARQALAGTLSRSPAGLTLSLSVWERGAQQPYWTGSTPVVHEDQFQAAMSQLQEALARALELDGKPMPWPSPPVLRSLARMQQSAPASADMDAAIAAAVDFEQPTLWWSLLEALEREGRVAEATTAARRARDALAQSPTRDAQRVLGYAQVLLGEDTAAVTTLERLLKQAPADHPLSLLLARAEAALGDLALAQQLLTAVVAADQRNLDAWYALGKYSIQSGDAKRAVDDYLVRAQVLANRSDDRRMQANVANALGIGYRRLGQLDAAAERLQYAQAVRGELGDRRGQSASLSNLATVRSIQGDFAAAQKALDEARAIIEPLGDAVALANLTNEVGVLAEERGDYRDALGAYRDALRLRQTQGDVRLIGESQINVGFAYYQLAEFDNAQTYWEQASSTYAGIDDRSGMVRARLGLGVAAVARGDWTGARASLQESLNESESLQMAEELSTSQAGLAELDRLEGRVAESLRHADAAGKAFEQREDLRGVVEMQLLKSALLSDIGDWTQAAAALGQVDASAVAHGEQASQYAWRQGEIALGQGDAQAALAAADLAVERAAKAHNFGSELTARLLRARALAALKRPKDALAELKRVEEGVARYASVPLRLLLAETALQVDVTRADTIYREARALLARLPSYGRAYQLHARAATGLRSDNSDAMSAAAKALNELIDQTPESSRPALLALAHSLAIQAPSP